MTYNQPYHFKISAMSTENNKRSLEPDADNDIETVVSKRVKNIACDLLREFECAICYETMAATCCLPSCGCNFCFHCIKQWYDYNPKAKCPCCNEHFVLEYAVANKRFDSIVRSFMTNGQVPKPVVDAWEIRVSEGIQEFKGFSQLKRRKPDILEAINSFPRNLPQPHRLAQPPNLNTTTPNHLTPPQVPVTREMMQVIIRARATQVIAAARLPQHADNAVLQRRAVRAQIVIDQIQSQIDAQNNEDAVQYTATVLQFDE
jgi:hypothetical protein